MDTMQWLQSWYHAQCDGDWEHRYGVKIETLDNPGWLLKIDLAHTDLEPRAFVEVKIHRSDLDWTECRLREGRFEGAGGPGNLIELIEVFRTWVKQQPGPV